MDEKAGAALLKKRFEAAGYRIRERWRYAADGVSFEMDGFDPEARIGYEYITTAAGDRADITPAVVAHLEDRMRRKELFVLLVDEDEAPDGALLTFAADRFLEAVGVPRKKTAAKKKPAKKPTKKKPAKKKKAVTAKKNLKKKAKK